MKTIALLVAVGLSSFGAGSLASATTGWRLVDSDERSGESFVSAHAKVLTIRHTKQLAVRVTGQPARLSWAFKCIGPNRIVRPGVTQVMDVGSADWCDADVAAGVLTGGTVGVQLLRK